MQEHKSEEAFRHCPEEALYQGAFSRSTLRSRSTHSKVLSTAAPLQAGSSISPQTSSRKQRPAY